MRRILSTVLSVTAAATLIAVPASQAQASAAHIVTVSGNMFITDDESWPFDDEHATVPFNTSVAVGTLVPTQTVVVKGCAGGEVRVELTLTVVHTGDARDSVRVSPVLRMYEGTSCNNNDLDGTTTVTSLTIGARGTGTWSNWQVKNTAEGGDHAEVNFAVVNTLN